MVNINEVIIYSIDKGEDSWAIEGEIIFESDLSTAFSLVYLPYEDEFEDFEMDINPGKYDKNMLKEMILESTYEYND